MSKPTEMTTCPKCQCNNISLEYVPPSKGNFSIVGWPPVPVSAPEEPEALCYICARCSYAEFHPPKDAKLDQEEDGLTGTHLWNPATGEGE